MSFIGLLGDVVTDFLKNENLRDYQHASRTFRSGNYGLLPKFKNQWHIAFEINTEDVTLSNALARAQMQADSNTRFSSASEKAADNITQMSVLCKNVKLPSYRFDTKRYNQYNRQVIGINKITYEPISIEFYDDSLNVIRNFWDCYYTYYIQDARYRRFKTLQGGMQIPAEWQQDNLVYSGLYTENFADHWGLDTSIYSDLDRSTPFFKSIKIYHFSRPVDAIGTTENNLPHYAEYTLINPIISAFEHDTLDYTSSEGTINRMTIEYETVLYNQGIIKEPAPGRLGNQIEEFAEISGFKQVNDRYRDKANSPLNNPTASILGRTGIINTAASLFDPNLSPLEIATTVGRSVVSWKQAGGVRGLINSATLEAKGIIDSNLSQAQQIAQSRTQSINVPQTQRNLSSSILNNLRILRK